MTGPEHTGRGRQPRSGATVAAVAVLILIPLVALLWVSSYAKATPKLWGFPFFYWYQFLWVFLAAGCTFLAYALLRRGGGRPRPDVRPRHRPAQGPGLGHHGPGHHGPGHDGPGHQR